MKTGKLTSLERLLLTTSVSANNIINKVEGKEKEEGVRDRHATREALNGKYNNHSNQARGSGHEELVNTKMEPV